MDQGDYKELVSTVIEGAIRYLGAAERSVTAAASGRSTPPNTTPDILPNTSPNLTPNIAPNTETAAGIASLIDHTLLKPEATREDIQKLCREAVRYGFASVCVNPSNVPLAAELVCGTKVKVCTVIAFPLGATLPEVKIREAEETIRLGAREVDMVINIGALKSGEDEAVEADIRGVVEAGHRGGALCKVIVETALLTREEKVRAAEASKRAGADFVKTSTGFSTDGATVEDVALLRSVVGPGMGVKASGGVRTLDDVKNMVRAGATRIGASAGVKIMEEAAAGRTGG